MYISKYTNMQIYRQSTSSKGKCFAQKEIFQRKKDVLKKNRMSIHMEKYQKYILKVCYLSFSLAEFVFTLLP